MTMKFTDFGTYVKKRIPLLIVGMLSLFSFLMFIGGVNEPWFTGMSRTMQLAVALGPGFLAIIIIIAMEIHDNVQALKKTLQQTKVKTTASLKKITAKQIIFYILLIIGMIVAACLATICSINAMSFIIKIFKIA